MINIVWHRVSLLQRKFQRQLLKKTNTTSLIGGCARTFRIILGREQMAAYDVIVIGAGVEGSATALHLAQDGQKTLLLEQFPLPHSRGSSQGHSRVIRKSYRQPFYTEMMKEATQFWVDLQQSSDVEIYKPISLLTIGKHGGQNMQDTKEAVIRMGSPFTELDNEAFKKQYAMLSYPSDYGAIVDLNGGLLRSDKVLNLFQKLFQSHGGEIRDGQRVLSVEPQDQQSVKVTTEHGQLTSRSVVLCCGPWTSDLTVSLGLSLPLQPIRISVCYWKEKEAGQNSYQKPPSFLDVNCDGGHKIYCLACDEYPGCVKIILHHGPEIHPDRRDAVDHSWVQSILSDYVDKHLPGLDPTPAVVEACIYTNTPDRHYILDTHPKWKNIIIGAGFSGHGFKLAPVVGRVLSELAQGKKPSFDLSPFRISRFSPTSDL